MQEPKPQAALSVDPGQDFEHALLRLQRGDPRHPDLRKAKREGRLRISIAAVALEAGRSRTLIGKKECAYPQVRRDVLAAVEAQKAMETQRVGQARLGTQDLIGDLRRENAILRHENAILATRVQDAVNIARRLEKKLDEVGRWNVRQARKEGRPEQLVGRALAGDNVVPFERGSE